MSIWKQLLGSLIRLFLIWVFGILVSHSVISQELAEKLTDSAAGYVLMAALVLLPILWTWGKARFNHYFAQEAINASKFDSVSDVKKQVYGKVKGTTSY